MKEIINFKRRIFISQFVIISMLFLSYVYLAAQDRNVKQFSFRNSNWGMLKDEVVYSENNLLRYYSYEENVLFRDDTLLGKVVKVRFYFNDNGLYKGTYDYNFKDDEWFAKLNNALKEKYGIPQVIDKSTSLGKHISFIWKTSASIITLTNYGTFIWLEYINMSLDNQDIQNGKL